MEGTETITTTGKVMFTDEELYEAIKDMPDFQKFPLPEHWYKKFNIEKPLPKTFQDFALGRDWLQHKFDENITYEVRTEPAPGGVRPIIESEPIPVEIITRDLTNGTSPDTSSPPQIERVPTTGSTEKEPQQS